jgi:hypothetical protein
MNNVTWPDGKRFAFTVCDDSDSGTLENLAPVYAFLEDYGFRTVRSCWAMRGDPHRGKYSGDTLDDADYRDWLVNLQSKGFEIGWHGATWQSSERAQVALALERFAQTFHQNPTVASNHTGLHEAMYWGIHRLSGWRRSLYNLLTCYRNSRQFVGHAEGGRYFWGDLCRQKIKYYRNFVFQGINTLKACPFMPYHDATKPYVNYWFASSNGRDADAFTRCISEANQDRLEAEGGACIMYTHFSIGFHDGRSLNPKFERLMKRLAAKNGWFVPAATLLDHLQAQNGPCTITDRQRRWLERKWLWEKVFVGTN